MKPITKSLVALAVSFSLAACGGRAANPVMVQQYGDQKKSCAALEMEMNSILQEISRLMPETDKTGKNVALGVTGVFFIVPLFFMDLSHAEQEEVNAYRQRYNNLLIIATDKKCGFKAKPVPEFKASEEDKTDNKPINQH